MKPEPSVFLPSTRDEALARLSDFLGEAAGDYAESRNHVVPGHTNVSRLSPATRTRLLLESEICEAARAKFPTEIIEKFEQEVWWRLYWKGWLEMRPELWNDYQTDLAEVKWFKRAEKVANGESGVAIMDQFARELVETGYLHNHARMWWASFWIHVERLPWQLGADFFHRYLLDGDAASNTLSWRWVAGLHTSGKSYLVRRSNLERYIDPGLLESNSQGLSQLENTEAIPEPHFKDHPNIKPVPLCALPEADALRGKRIGIWVHEEDLLVEKSPLADLSPAAIFAPAPTGLWMKHHYSSEKQHFLRRALADGVARAGKHFDLLSGISDSNDFVEALIQGARDQKVESLVAMQPFVGPLADELGVLGETLHVEGIELILIRRPDDVAAMNRATAGFFGFWKKTATLREGEPV